MIDVYYACKYYRQDMGLEQVRLTFGRGEVVGVFGENGSGKTTLLRGMAGLLALDYGNIEVDGRDPRLSANISFMSERGSFFPDLTISGHRELFQALFPSFSAWKFDLLIDYFALGSEKKIKSFSNGQQAKFELCCGMSMNVDWYLIDEPFLGKDFLSRRDFVKLLTGFLPEDSSLIMATHLAAEVEPLLTRVLVMAEGRVIADQPIESIYEKHTDLSGFLRQTCGYDEKRALELLDSVWSEQETN